MAATPSKSKKPAAKKKPVAKKPVAKKLAAKKPAAKKPAAKKEPVAKKPAAKKPAAKEPAKKKPAAKKAAASAEPGGAAKKIEAKIAELGDWRGERLAQIRALIHAVEPEVLEEWKWMGTPVWSREGMFVLANAHKDKVKLTFHHGAQLKDPGKLFNAGLDGNKWRAIDLRRDDVIDETKLAALLREAIAYNLSHSVPKSRGSNA